MKKIAHIVRRAATASPQEWRCRSQQMLYSGRNWISSRHGKSALSSRGHLRSLKLRRRDLAAWWKSRQQAWFIDVQRDKTLQNVASSSGGSLQWVLDQADVVLQGKMPLFSHPPVDFQGENRWHQDHILGKTAPRKYHGLIRYLDVSEVGDSKYVWEPNRFAWAMWLGLAYRVTADPRYAEKFAELTESWFRENPYPIGINYCSALEVGLRNYAWIWSMDLFAEFLSTEPRLLEQLIQGIWIGCNHVESNLSYYFAPNTHITGEAFSLYACGAAFSEFTQAPRWRSLGCNILANEVGRQFHEDGTHRELSTGYHIYSADFYLQASLISVQTGYQVPEIIVNASRQLGIRLNELAPSNLVMPQVNDCDGGRLTCLVPESLDAGPSLMATQMLHPDLRLATRGVDLRGYPLLMDPRRKELPRPTQPRIKTHFPYEKNASPLYDSGLTAYRNDHGDYVLFRATPFGYQDQPHSHDGPLGVVVHVGGHPLFVDNGVGSYTRCKQIRDRYRSAVGKNTLLVNGTGPSIPGDWFSWLRTTDCDLISLQRFRDGFRARGKHSGFSREPACHVFVQREVLLLDEGVMAIVDRWDADEEISIESVFTLHPEVELDEHGGLFVMPDGNSVHFHAATLSSRYAESVDPIRRTVPYSQNYGAESQTQGVGFDPIPSCRGGIVIVVSRVGEIERSLQNTIRFAEAPAIRLQVTDTGVEPVRIESGLATPEFVDSPLR